LDYFAQNIYLKNNFDINEEKIDLKEVGASIYNCPFISTSIEEGVNPSYQNDIKQTELESEIFFSAEDSKIEENNKFNYIIVKGDLSTKSKGAILLFHGLNERLWQKYLPWALTLNKLTGKAIILFPIAFHMNRAPSAWSNPRVMNKIASGRTNQITGINYSTFANAALSTRLHHNPSRFFTSGFQTFYDVTKLVGQIRNGNHKLISDDAKIDFFGYSIGALLAEVLLMANPKNYFDRTKLFLFCGGPTFDKMFPIAKAIMDSEAYNTTKGFFKLFEDYLRSGKFDRSSLPEIKYFKSLLTHSGLKSIRENRFMELKNKIFSVSLIKDKVIPPASVISTLNGAEKNIPIKTMISDFPFNYSHEAPFPTDEKQREIVNINFENIFGLASAYLG